MDRLEAMSIFVAVVESGSLAEASRRLGCSPASVTRAVTQLEAAAGERLLDRTTRRFNVTEAGSRHAAVYSVMLEEFRQLHSHERNMEITGTVVITAPELFGSMHVMPVVESFLQTYPQTQIRVLLLNRIVDLVGEGVDVAIRIAPLQDSSMHAIKVGEVRQLICGAPSYLDARPPLTHPSQLQGHWCIGLNEAGAHELWRYRESASSHRTRAIRVNCRLSLNSAGAAIRAAEHGLGLVRPLSYQVQRQIADRTLVNVLQEFELEPTPVNVLFWPRKSSSSAVRAFIGHASPLLKLATHSAA